jgi:hypothetical protein
MKVLIAWKCKANTTLEHSMSTSCRCFRIEV